MMQRFNSFEEYKKRENTRLRNAVCMAFDEKMVTEETDLSEWSDILRNNPTGINLRLFNFQKCYEEAVMDIRNWMNKNVYPLEAAYCYGDYSPTDFFGCRRYSTLSESFKVFLDYLFFNAPKIIKNHNFALQLRACYLLCNNVKVYNKHEYGEFIIGIPMMTSFLITQLVQVLAPLFNSRMTFVSNCVFKNLRARGLEVTVIDSPITGMTIDTLGYDFSNLNGISDPAVRTPLETKDLPKPVMQVLQEEQNAERMREQRESNGMSNIAIAEERQKEERELEARERIKEEGASRTSLQFTGENQLNTSVNVKERLAETMEQIRVENGVGNPTNPSPAPNIAALTEEESTEDPTEEPAEGHDEYIVDPDDCEEDEDYDDDDDEEVLESGDNEVDPDATEDDESSPESRNEVSVAETEPEAESAEEHTSDGADRTSTVQVPHKPEEEETPAEARSVEMGFNRCGGQFQGAVSDKPTDPMPTDPTFIFDPAVSKEIFKYFVNNSTVMLNHFLSPNAALDALVQAFREKRLLIEYPYLAESVVDAYDTVKNNDHIDDDVYNSAMRVVRDLLYKCNENRKILGTWSNGNAQ